MSVADWKNCELGGALTLQRGFDLPHRQRREGKVPIVSSSGISGSHDCAAVPGPGIVTGRYGTIGDVFYMTEDFWPLNTTLFVRDFKGNEPLFLSYLLRTCDFATHSGKSGVPGVNRNDIHQLRITLPPLPEQRAIAEALSDVDGLLGCLEALIAKKRAIKQAAMQQLLTGKTRLPGFTAEWETKRLGGIADIKNGATPSTQVASYWDGTIPWCTPTDITSTPGKYLENTERRITEAGLTSCAASLLPAGSLLLCSRATIGEVRIAQTEICTNQGFKSLVCRKGISNEFLYYLILTLKPQMLERAIGSTFLEIGKRDISTIATSLPAEDEQTAIATVLSDMDAEIAALEARRDKTRAIKQGMMQQLLTGRVRLVRPEVAA